MSKSAFATCVMMSGAVSCGAAQAQTCTAPEFLNTIVMAPVPGSDLMTVPITINGKEKQLLLDTGEPTTQVSEAMVRELGLPENTYTGGTKELNVKGSHTAADARARVRIAEFALGTQKGGGFQFFVSEDRELGKSKPYDGFLANDLFSNYDLDMDFASKRLNYFGPQHCPGQVVYWSQKPVAVVPITLTDRKINVPVTVDGKTLNAVIDTSAARTTLRRDIADVIFGLHVDTPEMMPAGDIRDGMDVRVYNHTFQSIAFEGVMLKNLAVLVQTNAMVRNRDDSFSLGSRAQTNAARIPDLTIGMDVLHQLHVYIAFGEKKLYVTPAGTGETEVFKAVAAGPGK